MYTCVHETITAGMLIVDVKTKVKKLKLVKKKIEMG